MPDLIPTDAAGTFEALVLQLTDAQATSEVLPTATQRATASATAEPTVEPTPTLETHVIQGYQMWNRTWTAKLSELGVVEFTPLNLTIARTGYVYSEWITSQVYQRGSRAQGFFPVVGFTLEGYIDEGYGNVIEGTLTEIFEGDPPFEPKSWVFYMRIANRQAVVDGRWLEVNRFCGSLIKTTTGEAKRFTGGQNEEDAGDSLCTWYPGYAP